ncbi:MAG: hypothetical protein IJZ30_02980 [Alphaproteobacteria bacterium]|nr:hypothetical protein [Alphaproteobacteria bacterium]
MHNTIITSNDYLERLYSCGNICLTASKMINIDAKYRHFLALFSDKTFFVDESVKTDNVIRDIVINFRFKYPTFGQLIWRYVSTDFLKEIYLKSQEFSWYAYQCNLLDNLSTTETKKLRNYLQSIKGLRCLSVTHLTTPLWYCYFSPDKVKFALFDNGYLVIAENTPYIDDFQASICSFFPQINIIKTVPEYYITATYEQLLYTQQSAREIYIELVKKELQNKYYCTEREAQLKLQQNPNQWKKLLFINEPKARSMIYSNYVKNYFNKKDTLSTKIN